MISMVLGPAMKMSARRFEQRLSTYRPIARHPQVNRRGGSAVGEIAYRAPPRRSGDASAVSLDRGVFWDYQLQGIPELNRP